jgi:hypothetical protein
LLEEYLICFVQTVGNKPWFHQLIGHQSLLLREFSIPIYSH